MYLNVSASVYRFDLRTCEIKQYGGYQAAQFKFFEYKHKLWFIQQERIRKLLVDGAKTLIIGEDTSYYAPCHLEPHASTNVIKCIDFKKGTYGFQVGFDTPFYMARYSDPGLQNGFL